MTFDRLARLTAATASRRLGNEVTIGATTGWGILLSPSEEVAGDMIIVTDYTLEIEEAVFGVVQRGAAVTVDGVAFTAREDAKPTERTFRGGMSDGATLRLALTKN